MLHKPNADAFRLFGNQVGEKQTKIKYDIKIASFSHKQKRKTNKNKISKVKSSNTKLTLFVVGVETPLI